MRDSWSDLWWKTPLLTLAMFAVVLIPACAEDHKKAEAEPTPVQKFIEKPGFDIPVYESGGNCVYVYIESIAAVHKPAGGC